MYLVIGKSNLVRTDEIIGIFDLDITSQSHITRAFLTDSEKSGQVVSVTEDIPKSYIVTSESSAQSRVYLAQPSSATLIRRLEYNSI